MPTRGGTTIINPIGGGYTIPGPFRDTLTPSPPYSDYASRNQNPWVPQDYAPASNPFGLASGPINPADRVRPGGRLAAPPTDPRYAELQARASFLQLLGEPSHSQRKARSKKKPKAKAPPKMSELEFNTRMRSAAGDTSMDWLLRPIGSGTGLPKTVKTPQRVRPPTLAEHHAASKELQRARAQAGQVAKQLPKAARILGRIAARGNPLLNAGMTAVDVLQTIIGQGTADQMARMEKALGPMIYKVGGKARLRSGLAKARAANPLKPAGALKVKEPKPVIRMKRLDTGKVPDFQREAQQEAKRQEKAQKDAEKQQKRREKEQQKEQKKREREQKRQQKQAQRKAQASARAREQYHRIYVRQQARAAKRQARENARQGAPGSLRRWVTDALGQVGVRGFSDIKGGLTGIKDAAVSSLGGGSPGQQCKAPDPCKQAAARRAATTRKRRLRSPDRICYAGRWYDTGRGRVFLKQKVIPCKK